MLPNFAILLNKIFAFIVYNAPTNLNYYNAFGYTSVFSTLLKEIKEKVLTFYEKLKKLINNPLIKKFRDNLLIGSLILTFVKLLFITTFSFRIFLLVFLTIFSFLSNGRELIKKPIKVLLKKSLGSEFLSDSFLDLSKGVQFENSLNEIESKYSLVLKKIKFELHYFQKYIFFQFFFYITFIRFFFDSFPKTYFVAYYSLILSIIYFEQAFFLSYLGLFLIATKLLVYIEENSLADIKLEIFQKQLNDEIQEKQLKISSFNSLLFLYFNTRKFDFNREISFDIYLYIRNMLEIKGIDNSSFYLSDKLPFEFVENNKKAFETGFYFGATLFSGGKVFIYSVLDINKTFLHNNYAAFNHSYLSIAANHRIAIYQHEFKDQDGNIFFSNFLMTQTSSKSGLLVPNSFPVAPHLFLNEECTLRACWIKMDFKSNLDIHTWLSNLFLGTRLISKSVIEHNDILFNNKNIDEDNFYDISSAEEVKDPVLQIEIKLNLNDHLSTKYDWKSMPKESSSIKIVNAYCTGQNENFIRDLYKKKIAHDEREIIKLKKETMNNPQHPSYKLMKNLEYSCNRTKHSYQLFEASRTSQPFNIISDGRNNSYLGNICGKPQNAINSNTELKIGDDID